MSRCDDESVLADIDMRAADYVERRDSDAWTENDEAELEAWLAESIAHRVSFLRLNSSWRRTERLVALHPPKEGPDIAPDPSSTAHYLKIAAVFGVILGLGGLLATYLTTPRTETYSTPVGGREILTLRDGSKIELNTSTSVRVALGGKERAVTVEKGEVYFHVRHDASRPFVVTAQGHRVVDLGTQFSLRVDRKAVKLALFEGSVRFDPDAHANAKPEVLTPGEVLTASVGHVLVKKEPLQDLLGSLAWRRGMIAFHNTTLAAAAAEFNRYNQTKIVLEDPRAATETINGMLPINDLAEFAHVAKNLFGLHAENHGDEIVLTR
jgi:transmembrane sensor